MKTIDQWLDEYGESHKNKINKTIHWICIPIIMFSLIGMLWTIPYPSVFDNIPFIGEHHLVNFGSIFLFLALLFYIRLSLPLFVGFIVVSTLIVVGNHEIFKALDGNRLYMLLASISIFVAAWIGQFIGHNIEGKKPSFFKDLQFLLIGPAWLLHFIYKKAGISYK